MNRFNKSIAQISRMIESGANIIDLGGESTRPGSKTIDPKTEWKRLEKVLKIFIKKYKQTCIQKVI